MDESPTRSMRGLLSREFNDINVKFYMKIHTNSNNCILGVGEVERNSRIVKCKPAMVTIKHAECVALVTNHFHALDVQKLYESWNREQRNEP